MYEYEMVQIPPNLVVEEKGMKGNEAAKYLQNIVNNYAEDGWEFQRIDTIGINVKPGCWASLTGSKESLTSYYVITFRRPKA